MDTENIWDLLSCLKDNNKNTNEISKCKDDISESDIDICENCGSKEIILEEGNFCCKNCNVIIKRFLDSNAEWRYYGADDSKSTDPTRCGMPINDLLPNSCVGSVISNQLNESYDMKIIRRYHSWNMMDYKTRTMYNTFEHITTNATNSGISNSIIEEAKILYKQLSESKITRGENKSGLIASSIYMSCKTNKVPRSTKEIAKMFNIKVTTMTKGCKKFQDIMKLNVESTTPEDFIQRFASKLNITPEIRELARHIVIKADELNIVSENTPPSVAAGAIYLCIIICKINICKKDLSIACEISQVTLTKCYKKLYENRGVLLPKETILKYNVK